MSDDKFAYVVTSENKVANPQWFTSLAPSHVLSEVRHLNARKNKPGSIITPPATVTFVHFDFEHQTIKSYTHQFPVGKAINRLPDTVQNIRDNPTRMWNALPANHFIIQAFERRKAQPGQPQTLSILDLYHAIREGPPGTVIDASIYSHGFVEGPVLMRTSFDILDQPETPPADATFAPLPGETERLPRRYPGDTDGRVRTDFSRNMGEDPTKAREGRNKDNTGFAIDEFRAGFTQGATFRVYGCQVQDVVYFNGNRAFIRGTAYEVINQAWTMPLKYAEAKSRETRDSGKSLRHMRNVYPDRDDMITTGKTLLKSTKASPQVLNSVLLDMEKESDIEDKLPPDRRQHYTKIEPLSALVGRHYTTDGDRYKSSPAGTFFNTTDTSGVPETSGQITRSYRQIIKYLAGQIMKTYVFQSAKTLTPKVTCFGGLPGSSGEREEGVGEAIRMHVRDDYRRLLRFYSIYLGVETFEPGADRQRNYGVFNAGAVADVTRHRSEG